MPRTTKEVTKKKEENLNSKNTKNTKSKTAVTRSKRGPLPTWLFP